MAERHVTLRHVTGARPKTAPRGLAYGLDRARAYLLRVHSTDRGTYGFTHRQDRVVGRTDGIFAHV